MFNSFNTMAIWLFSETKEGAFNQKRNKNIVTNDTKSSTTYAKSYCQQLSSQKTQITTTVLHDL